MTEILPQLLFLNDRSLPIDIHSTVYHKLLLDVGRMFKKIDRACDVFDECVSLFYAVCSDFANLVNDPFTSMNIQLSSNQKTPSTSRFSTIRTKSNQNELLYLYSYSTSLSCLAMRINRFICC